MISIFIYAGYDFLNSSSQNFNVEIWYNASLRENILVGGGAPPVFLRLSRAVNTVIFSNSQETENFDNSINQKISSDSLKDASDSLRYQMHISKP